MAAIWIGLRRLLYRVYMSIIQVLVGDPVSAGTFSVSSRC